jgi:HD-like signal output (HDOD) protein/DNA-binding response OmpR family regulator
MANILLIDDEAVIREPIAAVLHANGHKVSCASDPATAIKAVEQLTPELVLLDIQLGNADGLSLLSDFRARPALVSTPVLLLTGVADKSVILRAAKLGVQGYILKSTFSTKELLTRVDGVLNGIKGNGHLAATSQPPGTPPAHDPPEENAAAPLLTRDESIQRVKETLGAKTLSGVVMQVIKMAASPTTDLSELGAVIARDSFLSARVLQVANSAAFTTSSKTIFDIHDALRQIGCATVRDIAAAMGVFDAVPPRPGAAFDPVRSWQHSLTVAHLCQHLASASQPDQAGIAYLVGLCHDLGEVLLHTYFEKEFAIIRTRHIQSGTPLPELERKMLGVRRSELADLLLTHLGLPPAIRTPIEQFHQYTPASRAELPDGFSAILQMADLYANGLQLAASGSSPISLVTTAESKRAVGQEHPPRPDSQLLRSNMAMLAGTLARLGPTELRRLLEPLQERTKAKIFISRHPAISAWDPITTLLESLSEAVTVSDHLPSRVEFGDHTHLAILSPSPTAKAFNLASIDAALTDLPSPKALWIFPPKDTIEVEPSKPIVSLKLPLSIDSLIKSLVA